MFHVRVRNSRENDRQKSSWAPDEDHSVSSALTKVALQYVVPLYHITEFCLMEREKLDLSVKS